MTNEITIVSDSRGLPVRQADAWAGGMTYAGPPGPQAPHGHSSVFKKMHQLLRGRYPLAITLALTCGLLAGIGGYMFRKPMYAGVAIINIKPTLSNPVIIDPSIQIPDVNTFVEMLIMEMSSPDIVGAAMIRPEWTKAHSVVGQDVNAFISNLDVEKVITTDMVNITYHDPDPRAAQAGAQALEAAFLEWYQAADPFGRRNILTLLTGKQHDLSGKVADLDNEIAGYQLQMANSAEATYRIGQIEELIALENQVAEAQTKLDEYQTAVGTTITVAPSDHGTPPGAANPSGTSPSDASTLPPSNEEIARVDPYMRNLLLQKSAAEANVLLIERDYPPGSVAAQRATDEVDLQDSRIKEYASEWQAARLAKQSMPQAPVETNNNNGGVTAVPMAVTQADVDHAKAELSDLQRRQEAQEEVVKKNNDLQTRVDKAKDDRGQAQASLDKVTSQIAQLNDQITLDQNQVSAVGTVALPASPSDHKPAMLGILGFILGAALPVGILLLIGSFDRRYRFSDETNKEMSGIPLLGILPNLPDLLSDPDQAATAAHCVHQIRTLLQINSHTNDRRSFCVTSSSSGDGKTSLTLALGLSFAASGSKTLVIDADLVGGGLSARLGIHSDKGVLDAMASQKLADCIQLTDVGGLSILPIGQAIGSFAGTISPAAIRRLVAEARKQFDIVLIDTGPILGSIEASPVAAACDAVILCVSRGQQRPLVDRAMAHLQAIGARLAGVVFNRAQARDFELSVSRSVQSSVPAQGNGRNGSNGNGSNGSNGSNGARNGHSMGPVAKAVASSVKSE